MEVDEESNEAKTWPLFDENSVVTATSSANPTSAVPTSEGHHPQILAAPSGSSKPRPVAARKPRKTLGDIPLAKGKKISTLDKSLMDWNAHIDKEVEVKDELESKRKGGGFIEKMEFMERVSARKDDERSAQNSKRRRT